MAFLLLHNYTDFIENSNLKAYIDKLNKAKQDVKDTANKSQQIVDQHQ